MLLLPGCITSKKTVRFSEVAKNIALPTHFKSRNLFGKPGPLIYKLEDFAGIVVEETKPNHYRRLYKLKNLGDEIKVEVPDAKGQPIYESKIDKNAKLNGSYLAFAADFSAQQVEHIQIMDVGLVFAPWKQIHASENELRRWIAANPANGKKRFLVQGALLTLILGTSTNVVAAGSQVSTPVFKVNGELRRLDSTTRRDYQVALALIDLRTLVAPGPKSLLDPIDRLFDSSTKAKPSWVENTRIAGIAGIGSEIK